MVARHLRFLWLRSSGFRCNGRFLSHCWLLLIILFLKIFISIFYRLQSSTLKKKKNLFLICFPHFFLVWLGRVTGRLPEYLRKASRPALLITVYRLSVFFHRIFFLKEIWLGGLMNRKNAFFDFFSGNKPDTDHEPWRTGLNTFQVLSVL